MPNGRRSGTMDPTPLIERILDDEGIASGLDEPEATLLISTLIDRMREMGRRCIDESARRQAEWLIQRARAIAEVVCAFRDNGEDWARVVGARLAVTWVRKASTHSQLLRILLADMHM
jgi:hypothetical protein